MTRLRAVAPAQLSAAFLAELDEAARLADALEDERDRPVPDAGRVVAVDRGDLGAVLAEVQALRILVSRLAPRMLGGSRYQVAEVNAAAFRRMAAAGGFRPAGSWPDIVVGYQSYAAGRREITGNPRPDGGPW